MMRKNLWEKPNSSSSMRGESEIINHYSYEMSFRMSVLWIKKSWDEHRTGLMITAAVLRYYSAVSRSVRSSTEAKVRPGHTSSLGSSWGSIHSSSRSVTSVSFCFLKMWIKFLV